jgi:hypothetical protein
MIDREFFLGLIKTHILYRAIKNLTTFPSIIKR